ncbi:MAG: hypothetical protein ABI836_08605 [Gemmatimonadota bacterium]
MGHGNLQPGSGIEAVQLLGYRIELAVKLGRGAEARAWLDSLAALDVASNTNMIAILGSLVGRTGRLAALVESFTRTSPAWVAVFRRADESPDRRAV